MWADNDDKLLPADMGVNTVNRVYAFSSFYFHMHTPLKIKQLLLLKPIHHPE